MPSEQFNNMVQMFKMQRNAAPAGPINVVELRQGFEMLGQMMPAVEGVSITDIDVAGMPASRIEPEGASDDRVILYLHGGGYCIGSKNSHAPLVANLSKAAGVTAVLPEYRLGPEDPYPAAVDDAIAAYDWVLAQGYAPSKIAVAGESAGGGLTGALLVRLRDEGKALPSSATLISPWCDLTGLGEPTEAQLDTDFLRPEQIEFFTNSYAPVAEHRPDPTCSPGVADLTGLPPLLIQVGGKEILCGMGERMAARAKDAGVDVTLDVEPDMFHAWPLFAGALPESDEAIARIASFMKSRFS
jgi:epsilon-lactone hydrolase